MSSEDQVRRTMARLQDLIRLSPFSQREIERRLDWGQGYISQISHGRVGAKLRHIFEILEVIGAQPEDLFVGMGDADKRSSNLDDQIYVTPNLTVEELKCFIRETVAEYEAEADIDQSAQAASTARTAR